MELQIVEPRCKEKVDVRDTYRYTGRGPGGFQMHYTHRSCNRTHQENGFCWQHQPGWNSVDAMLERSRKRREQ